MRARRSSAIARWSNASWLSQSVLDSSEAEVAALSARLAAARSEVDVAIAQVGLGKQELADLEIRAPFKGVVISKDAQPGEMVSPMSAGGGFTRTGVATIVDMDSREVEVDVNESYINRVSAGQKVECVLDAYPDLKIPAHVISIVPTADRQKATVRVRIGLDQLDPRILPDMGIKVSFFEDGSQPAAKGALLVPENAVVREGEASFVWVVRDGKVEKRAVKVGLREGRAGAGHRRSRGWRVHRRRRAQAPARRRGRGAEGSVMNAAPPRCGGNVDRPHPRPGEGIPSRFGDRASARRPLARHPAG